MATLVQDEISSIKIYDLAENLVDEYRINHGFGSWVKKSGDIISGIYLIQVNNSKELRKILIA